MTVMFWLFLPTLVAAGFFSDHVEKYLNHDVDPCDDFYTHVCPAKDHHFHTEASRFFSTFTQQLVSPKIHEFTLQVLRNNENFPDVQMEPEDKTVLEQLFKDVGSPCWLPHPLFSDEALLITIDAYEAHYRLQSTPHYNTLKKKMTDIFTVLKEIVGDEFAKAPWTSMHPNFVEFMKSVELRHLNNSYPHMEKDTMEIKQRYESCLGITTNETKALSYLCLNYALCPIKQRLVTINGKTEVFIKIMLEYYQTKLFYQAQYNSEENFVELSPVIYKIEEDELPFMLGSVDFTISHEMGHIFFHGKAAPSNSECFRKHMQGTCNTYLNNKAECSLYDLNWDKKPVVNGNYSRLGDDASDWIGMHAGLISLKKYYPEIFSQTDKLKSSELLKKFFYAHAINWCSEYSEQGDKPHSPNKVRVNGIASLFPEFSEVFQCKRGNKMAKAGTCLPFAGFGAPTNKRHRHQ